MVDEDDNFLLEHFLFESYIEILKQTNLSSVVLVSFLEGCKIFWRFQSFKVVSCDACFKKNKDVKDRSSYKPTK